jgi:hypothetical protein
MSDEQFYNWVEFIRVWTLDEYKNNKHPIMMGSKTVVDIARGFTKFNMMDVSRFYFREGDNKYLFGQSNKWANGINHWFPEIAETKISNKWPETVFHLFERKEYFHRAMRAVVFNDALKTFYKYPDSPIFHVWVKVLKITRGVQVASNFPAHIAKWIYLDGLLKSEDETLYVYDPSMGWGARLISLFAASSHLYLSGKKIDFIGTDVNKVTHERFKMIYDFWKHFVNPDLKVKVKKYVVPAEDIHLTKGFQERIGKGHIAFTSPPYFDKERYNDDPDQSYIRYKTYDEWTKGFLYGMIKNTHLFLQKGGLFYLNIANVGGVKKSEKYPILDSTLAIAKEIGFEIADEYKMLIAYISGKDTEKIQTVFARGSEWKTEPIYKFRKK